jgi:hypothetical protein
VALRVADQDAAHEQERCRKHGRRRELLLARVPSRGAESRQHPIRVTCFRCQASGKRVTSSNQSIERRHECANARFGRREEPTAHIIDSTLRVIARVASRSRDGVLARSLLARAKPRQTLGNELVRARWRRVSARAGY